MVNITIDGKKVQVPEGTTVLRAAEAAGISIPTLCDHKELKPYGGCRMCVVEVEGMRTLQPSCTLPVGNNMVIHTNTEKVANARKFVLSLIFSERNHFCMYCQVSGGDCELQNAAYREGMTHWPLQPDWQSYAMDASHPYIIIENNRCILCRRCSRACGELVGNFTLDFEERGANSKLVADYGVPLGESTCISCGVCVQVCPTGAIIDRRSAYQGRETQLTHTNSICTVCSVGCGIEVLTRDNHLVRIEGDWDAPANEGLLCKLGRFDPLDENRERITTPMVRQNGTLKATSWEEAVSVIAERLMPLSGKKGGGLAAAASGRLSVEALYLFKQIFTNCLASDMVTSLDENGAPAAFTTLAAETGKAFEGTLEEVKSADAVLTLGVDLTQDHQVAGFFVKRALPQGLKLVTVSSQPTSMDHQADCHLACGKDGIQDVVQALLSAVVEGGMAKEGISTPVSLDAAATKAGICSENLLKAAQILCAAKHPVIIYGQPSELATLTGIIELAKAIGAVDGQHSALVSLKGQANAVAAAQYQLDRPFQVNGQQAAFIILGEDRPAQKLIQSLDKIPFLVVQATYASPLTARADVVLPVASWAEEDGHYVNLEGRLQQARKSLVPLAGVMSNEAALQALAARLGFDPDSGWNEALYQQTTAVAIG
jgi:formate dehydrogenase major subunit